MDGENNGKPYFLMDDSEYYHFWKPPYIIYPHIYYRLTNSPYQRSSSDLGGWRVCLG